MKLAILLWFPSQSSSGTGQPSTRKITLRSSIFPLNIPFLLSPFISVIHYLIKLFLFLFFQLPTSPWSSNPVGPRQYAAMSGSCMAPHTNLPSFMGLANPNHLQPASHQTPTAAIPLSTAQGTTSMVLSPAVQPGSVPATALDPCHDTERRSSSIASLRLKAREHSAAMGILSVYGKS